VRYWDQTLLEDIVTTKRLDHMTCQGGRVKEMMRL